MTRLMLSVAALGMIAAPAMAAPKTVAPAPAKHKIVKVAKVTTTTAKKAK